MGSSIAEAVEPHPIQIQLNHNREKSLLHRLAPEVITGIVKNLDEVSIACLCLTSSYLYKWIEHVKPAYLSQCAKSKISCILERDNPETNHPNCGVCKIRHAKSQFTNKDLYFPKLAGIGKNLLGAPPATRFCLLSLPWLVVDTVGDSTRGRWVSRMVPMCMYLPSSSFPNNA